MNAGTRTWPLWLASIGAALLYAWWFYPGVLSFDAAYAWWQVRGGETSNLQAPMMMRVWQACNALLPGPGLLFLLHLAMFWSGLALIATTLRRGTATRIAFLLIAAGAPVPFVLFSHIWTDVALMAALTLAFGALLRLRDGGRGGWWLPAGLALFYASGVRLNALPAVVPFILFAAHLLAKRRYGNAGHNGARGHFSRVAVIAIGILLSLGIAVAIVNQRVERHVALMPTLQMCDLAAMSATTGKLLLPAFALRRGSDVDFFRRAKTPWGCLPMLAGTREPSSARWTVAERRALTRAWLAAIVRHPLAYLRHRVDLTRALLGSRAPDWPYQLVFVDANVRYRDNPPVNANHSAPHAFWMRLFHAAWDTIWLSAWPYLLLAAGVLAGACRRRRASAGSGLAVVVGTSGLLYALPYFFVAASAELRYVGWTCLAAVLAAGILVLGRAPNENTDW
ncbi:MAG: hypothetical protein WBW61_04700 [Rhodanobacteraceae bacterium]